MNWIKADDQLPPEGEQVLWCVAYPNWETTGIRGYRNPHVFMGERQGDAVLSADRYYRVLCDDTQQFWWKEFELPTGVLASDTAPARLT